MSIVNANIANNTIWNNFTYEKSNDPHADQLLQVFSKLIARLIIVKTDMINWTLLSNLRPLTLKYTSNTQLKNIRAQDLPLLEILHIYVYQLQKAFRSSGSDLRCLVFHGPQRNHQTML